MNSANVSFWSKSRSIVLKKSSTSASVVGTPEELRTLYHSSFVRLSFLSLSALSKYLFTSRYFLISTSAVAKELPLLKKLMLANFVFLDQCLKVQMSKHQGDSH